MCDCEHSQTAFLYKLARALHQQNLEADRVAQTVVSLTGEAIRVDYGCLITFRDGSTIEKVYVLGTVKDPQAEMEMWETLWKRGLVGFVQHSQRTIVIRSIATDPRWPHTPMSLSIPLTGSAVGLPLKRGSYVDGVLLFIHPEVDYFCEETVRLLEEVTDMASIALGNALDFQAARAADVRYHMLFEDAVVPMILTDLRGTIVDVNRKAGAFIGRDRFDLLKRPITDLHPLDADLLEAQLQSMRLDEEIIFRSSLYPDEHSEVPVVIRARRITVGQRALIEWVEQDVTAQMELEQLRRDLSAMVYHDLRGPLQAVKGSLYKLGQVLANHENPAVLTLLQVGIRSTRQLQRMVDSLLDIQRIEAGKAVLDCKPVELRVLLTDAAQLVQPLAAEASQRLQFDFKPDLPMVLLDNDMILRVVTNLMENAIKYTPEGGVIKLSARLTGDGVQVSVRDSGPGIPYHMQQQIFDKFSRVKYKDAPKGIGLGLAFCRLAVEAHGGTIRVESEPGSGSEFIFTLPLSTIIASTEAPVLASSA